MKGLDNCFIGTGGGTGLDVVWVKNFSEAQIDSGMQVLLSAAAPSETKTYMYPARSAVVQSFCDFWDNDTVLSFDTAGVWKWYYDAVSDTLVCEEIGSGYNTAAYSKCFHYDEAYHLWVLSGEPIKAGIVLSQGFNASAMFNWGTGLFYIGAGLAFKKRSSVAEVELWSFDPITGEFLSEAPLRTIELANGADISAVSDADNRRFLYKVLGAAETFLCDATGEVITHCLGEKNVSLQGCTGLKPGEFVICRGGGHNDRSNMQYGTFKAYRFDDNMQLTTDLAGSGIETEVGAAVVAVYNPRTKLLTINTAAACRFYRYNSAAQRFDNVTPMNFPESFSTTALSNIYRWWGSLSLDEGKMVICVPEDVSSSLKSRYYLFLLGKDGDELKIVSDLPRNYLPGKSFTGVATGKKSDDGRYEVKAVIGLQSCRLSIDFNEVPDEFIIEGDVR